MKLVPNAVSRKVALTILKTKKNSPALLFAGGVVGVVGTTVLACRSTLKLEEVMAESQNKMDMARRLHSEGRQDYQDKDFNQDMTKLYVEAVGSLVKLYAPALILGTISIASLAGAHNILNKRNAGLTAAYAAVERGFAEYRKRVIAEVGEEKEREIHYGAKDVEYAIDTPKGTRIETDKRYGDDLGHSPYAVIFDEHSSTEWQPSRDYNRAFIELQEQWLTDRLRVRGYVTLNQALERLGMKPSKMGAVVGWVYDPYKEIGGEGDNYVSFGINRQGEQFFHGPFNAVLLDFNVDGNILNQLDRL